VIRRSWILEKLGEARRPAGHTGPSGHKDDPLYQIRGHRPSVEYLSELGTTLAVGPWGTTGEVPGAARSRPLAGFDSGQRCRGFRRADRHGPIALFFLTYAAMYQCRGKGL
jgi:hypothetical protein